MRRSTHLLLAGALVAGSLSALPSASAAPQGPGQSGLEVYVGQVNPAQLEELAALGLDREDVATGPAPDGQVAVEAIITDAEAAKLRSAGVDLEVKQVDGVDASESLRAQADVGHTVYRSYSEDGGIRDELVATAKANPKTSKLVTIGQTVTGQDILALKVTKDARRVKDGKRPAVLYNSAQHSREWITPEMTRRLMHHYLDGYGKDRQITKLVDTTELWFVPVSNPDGYDFSFTEGNRLWRKNTRDNNNDGTITAGDGVDPNRNYPTKWAYDNEGSSPEPSSETYRGPSPASEPETQALDGLMKRIGFAFQVNYHSAAELLLYGTGWQVSTPSPDDVVYEALAGTEDNSAVPGYDPDLSAELYTTNGETTEHAHNEYGILAFTPEMTTCQTVSASIPDDEWLPEDCESGFNFPDDEELIQAEFEKNIPFALSLAQSAKDPGNPVSSVGLDAPDFVIDPFEVSYGSEQPVAVTASRGLDHLRLHYSVNGARAERSDVQEWEGGERYGGEQNVYYAEYRGMVEDIEPGDEVEVWFSGRLDDDDDDDGEDDAARSASKADDDDETVVSERFTYTMASDVGGDVLVVAAEDVTGISPVQGVTSANYADDYAKALDEAGYSSDVYDVDVNERTAPHHLGVLAHYDAVVWETGDDIITREVGQVGGTAAELALDLQLSARDYLNEGGKLLYTGQFAGFAAGADGAYFYNPFEEEQGECTTPGVYPCLPLLNDFNQYWLGAYTYVDDSGTNPDDGNPYPVDGVQGAFDGFAGTLNGGDSADNQAHTAAFLSTSSFLPAEQFPQFASAAPLKWQRPGGAPYEPFTGDYYVYSQQADVSYKRLATTVAVPAAGGATLDFRTSFDTEADWDYVTVEARTVGRDDWTTLPDINGHTTQDTGASCPGGWGERLHPQLLRYQTLAAGVCTPTGTTGEWHAATGSSAGWQEWQVDLAAAFPAGGDVEVSISYISDDAIQGLGTFVDDARVTVGGVETGTSFEVDLAPWAVPGAPEGSQANANDFIRSLTAFEEGAGVTTDDTVYVGFGVEGLTTQDMRTDLVRRSLTHLMAP